MATSESTSVILLDMNLPIMDGWEASRHLKANTDTKGIPNTKVFRSRDDFGLR